ncbi:MAG: AgmX/PglI C-terminal domain-containing protein [Myxococcaceae bacterium]
MSNRPLAFIVAIFILLCGLGLWMIDVSEPPRSSPGSPDLQRTPAVARALPETQSPRQTPPSSIAPSRSPTAPTTNAQSDFARTTTPALMLQPPASETGSAGEKTPGKGVPRQQIREAIASVRAQVRECYEKIMDRYPPPQKVVLKFTIRGKGISGHMDEGEILESTIEDPLALSCFLEAVADARFPAPASEDVVTVSYPFLFREPPAVDAGMP